MEQLLDTPSPFDSHAIFGCTYQDNWKFIYWCILSNSNLSRAAKGKIEFWLNNLKGTESFTSPETPVFIQCFKIINVIWKPKNIPNLALKIWVGAEEASIWVEDVPELGVLTAYTSVSWFLILFRSSLELVFVVIIVILFIGHDISDMK